MNLPIFHVDAFSNRLFSGNPAAVVLVRESLPDSTLQAIATENNLSETAFVRESQGTFFLRWFTPVTEVDLCGHATLAAAFVLFTLKRAKDSVAFETQSGSVSVCKEDRLYRLDFPSRPPVPSELDDAVVEAVGGAPTEALTARDLLLVYGSEREVQALEPDFDLLSQLNLIAVIATAPGRQVDFVSRFFAPRLGVREDPVTGSSHCTLTPFWAARLNKSKLHAHQVSKRGGELFCEDRGDRVLISGEAVEYSRGEIHI